MRKRSVSQTRVKLNELPSVKHHDLFTNLFTRAKENHNTENRRLQIQLVTLPS